MILFSINAYIMSNRNNGFTDKIVCKNGLTLSVQASSFHYCSPRNDSGPWNKVEVGYPSRKIEDLMEYAENPAAPTETVYAFVPHDVIEKIVLDNGGLL